MNFKRVKSIKDALFGRIFEISYPGNLEDDIKRIRRVFEGQLNRIEWEWNSRFSKGKMTCPLRMNDFGPWKREEGMDYWRPQGKDLCCSFCGSWKDDQFLKHIDQVIADKGDMYAVELNDGKDKIYVTRPSVFNAGDGAVKYKLGHLWAYNRTITEAQKQINADKIFDAVRLSNKAFYKKHHPAGASQ